MSDMEGGKDARSKVELIFEGLPEAPLQVGSRCLRSLIERHLNRWPSIVRSARDSNGTFRVTQTRRGFRLDMSQGEGELFATSAELLCDLGIELAEAYVRQTPGLQCLHCAAVALPGLEGERLVVFPNVNRAGKSLLAASFLRYGARIFADDLLAVTESGHGMAFGLPPRLRLPLPASVPYLAGMLKNMAGHGDRRYRFLYPGSSLASFGDELPFGAIVLPRRIADGAGHDPRLRRLSAAGALQCMAYQFQMREGQAGDVLSLACRLCESLPLWVLEYDSPEDAAALLVREAGRLFSFSYDSGEEVLPTADFLTKDDLIGLSRSGRTNPFPLDRDLRWRRSSDVHVHERDGFAYIIPKEQDSIFGVDGIGHAVFALLEEPLSINEAAGLLAEVFPEVRTEQLESDVAGFFRILYENRLLLRDGS